MEDREEKVRSGSKPCGEAACEAEGLSTGSRERDPKGRGGRGKRIPFLERLLSRDTVLLLARGLGLLVLAFLFDRCQTVLSAQPFGLALLCAAESGLPFIYGGLFLSALPLFGSGFRPVALIVATATVLLRVAVRMTVDLPWKRNEAPDVRTFRAFCGTLFREHTALRMMAAAVGAFLVGLYAMIGGGYQVYDLLASLLLVVVTPLATLLLAGLWRGEIHSLHGARELIYVVGFLSLLTLSLREISLYRVSLGVFLALGVTLWITLRKGIAVGILAGLALGLAVDPITAPLYALGAVALGAMKRVSILLGAVSALSVGMAWGLYVYGLGALSGLFPGLLAGALVFCVLERLGFLPYGEGEDESPPEREALPEEDPDALPRGREDGEAEVRALESALAAERLRDEEARIEELCGAFLSVSDLLRALRENSKVPSAEEYRRVCDRVCDEFCPGCVSCTLCWGSEYARMAGVLGHMAEELRRTGRVSAEAFPEEVRRRCQMSGAIFLRINEEAGALTAAAIKREKAGLLSADYSAAASLFRSASRSAPVDYSVDAGKSLAADGFLYAHGLRPARVAVSGGRRGCLYAWNVEREAAEKLFLDEAVRSAFLETLGFFPGAPALTPVPGGGGLCDLRVPAAPRFRMESATVSRSARHDGEEEGLCGDSVTVFENGNGRVFALLSDGMGSGRNAAHLSGICTVFLQKMLSAGGETGVILKMLNDFLVAGSTGESSATVDLLDLDLYTGEGVFWKSGAAPSFVLREGNLMRLVSRTAPAGILPEADVQKTVFRLYDGDLVVMVSDGVSDGGEECEYLESLLCGVDDEESLLHAAERVADSRGFASDAGDLDDRSVILLRVGRAESDAVTGEGDGEEKSA